MSNAKIKIRSATAQDKDIVLATWLRGAYYGSDYFIEMDQDQYFDLYGKYVTKLLFKKGTQVDCAVLEDAPNVVLGYIVYNDHKLYWAYVKRDFRKQGIMNLLLKNMDFTEYSGHTRIGTSIGRKKELKFNPLGDL